jgi:hypothetical protein
MWSVPPRSRLIALLALARVLAACAGNKTDRDVDAGDMLSAAAERDAAPAHGDGEVRDPAQVANDTAFSVRLVADRPVTGVCPGTCVELTAHAEHGVTPYRYAFEPNIGSGPGPHRVCPTQTTRYQVTATDSSFDGEFGGKNAPAIQGVTIEVDPKCGAAQDGGTPLDAALTDAQGASTDAAQLVDAGPDTGQQTQPPGSLLCSKAIATIPFVPDQTSHFDIWNDDFDRKVVVDASGQVIIASTFLGTITLADGRTLSSGAGLAVLVAKVDAMCTPVWFTALQGYRGTHEPTIAVDSKGRVVVLASTQSEHPVSSQFSTNAIYLAVLSSSGALVWEKRIESAPNLQWQRALRVDANDDIVLMTSAQSGSNFGGGAMGVADPTQQDPTVTVLAKYRSDGTHAWSRVVADNATRASLAILGSTDIVLHGWSSGARSWGAGGSTSGTKAGGAHGYLARATSAVGAYSWSKQVSDAEVERYSWHALDANQAGQLVTSNFGATGELALVSASGDSVWKRRIIDQSSALLDDWSKIALDAQGNVFVGGTFATSSTINGVSLTSGMDGSTDAFVQRLGPSGAPVWTFQSRTLTVDPLFGEELVGMAPGSGGSAFALMTTATWETLSLVLAKVAP